MVVTKKAKKTAVKVCAELYSHKSVFIVEQNISDKNAEKVKEAIRAALGEETESEASK